MISKLKKIVLFITATLFVGTSSVFANDINQQTTDPVNINQNNTTINFTNQGCINYVMTSESPARAISIDNNSANDISNLTIDILEYVVLFRSACCHTLESLTILKAFRGIDAEHGSA